MRDKSVSTICLLPTCMPRNVTLLGSAGPGCHWLCHIAPDNASGIKPISIICWQSLHVGGLVWWCRPSKMVSQECHQVKAEIQSDNVKGMRAKGVAYPALFALVLFSELQGGPRKLGQLRGAKGLAVKLLYGCGLRQAQAAQVRVICCWQTTTSGRARRCWATAMSRRR